MAIVNEEKPFGASHSKSSADNVRHCGNANRQCTSTSSICDISDT